MRGSVVAAALDGFECSGTIIATQWVVTAHHCQSTPEQLANGLKALEIKLSVGDLAALDEIFPGYQPAPEHYAW